MTDARVKAPSGLSAADVVRIAARRAGVPARLNLGGTASVDGAVAAFASLRRQGWSADVGDPDGSIAFAVHLLSNDPDLSPVDGSDRGGVVVNHPVHGSWKCRGVGGSPGLPTLNVANKNPAELTDAMLTDHASELRAAWGEQAYDAEVSRRRMGYFERRTDADTWAMREKGKSFEDLVKSEAGRRLEEAEVALEVLRDRADTAERRASKAERIAADAREAEAKAAAAAKKDGGDDGDD